MREGEAGRMRFSQITRIVTVPLAFLQAIGNTALFVQLWCLDEFQPLRSEALRWSPGRLCSLLRQAP